MIESICTPQEEGRRISVACDLFLDLKLYRLPEWAHTQLERRFPDVDIVEVNTPSSSLFSEQSEIYWGNRITPDIIEKMPNLKWIHFGSVGVNRVNIQDLSRQNILVTSSKGGVVYPMVASALSFMTGLARGVHYVQKMREDGTMSRESFDAYFDRIHDLLGERCLIVGFGDVGKHLARVCDALGMHVSAIEREPSCHKLVDSSFTLDKLPDAVLEADYVINLLPLNNDTKGVFNRKVFSRMSRNAFFINIGRGETVDEDALIDALNKGVIAGAGLDVFAKEPLTIDSPLWKMENVMLSPHIAGLSQSYWKGQIELFQYNLKCYVENRSYSMKNLVNG